MKNIYHKYTLLCRLFTLLACLSFSAAYGSRGIDPVSGRKADPAKTTADLLRRRLIQQQLNAQSSDPLYFMLRSNKTEVKPGEEVELTLSVHLLQDAHKTFIVYEELFGYTLRLIMPEGFVVNGGSYHDLLRDRVTRRDPVKTYTVKGYFEDYAEDYEFKLLRGVYYHQLSDNMILKQVLSVSTTNEKPFDPNKKEKVSSKIEKRELMSDVYSIAAVETIPDQPLKNAEFCTTNSFSVSKGSRFDFDDRRTCLREVYAPKWFIINVTKAGSLKLKISSPNNDVDFVCYGPYNIPLEDLRNRTWDNMRTNDRIQDASYNNAKVEHCTWGMATEINCNKSQTALAEVGYYILMVSNFSATNTTIDIQKVEGSAVTGCGGPIVNPCVKSPVLSHQSDPHVVRGNNVYLSVAGCTSNIVWKRNGTDLPVEKSPNLTAYETGTYSVTCDIDACVAKNSDSIVVSHGGNLKLTHDQPSLSISPTQVVKLIAEGCNTKYEWSTGQTKTHEIYITGPGTYSVRCVNDINSAFFSSNTSITFPPKTGNPPTIVADGTHCLRAGETKNITATCNTGYTLYWGDSNTGKISDARSVGSGTYKAKCCLGGNCSTEVSVEICNDSSPHPCTLLQTPVASLNPNIVKLGDYFEVRVEGCSGELTWFKDKAYFKGGVTSFWTNEKGSYYAACLYKNCDSTVKNSNTVSPNYTPLVIEHNVPNNEVISGVPFELRAVGCAEGAVEWYTAAGTTRQENPIWESLPGLYKARCRKDDNVYSDWVTVFMTLRSATTPQFSKPDQCFYANQTLYISGTCPTGMTLRWNDNTTATSFPAYKQVTPGTYSAQCCNGSNCSAMTPVTICTLTPNIQQINTNKDDPMTGIAYAAPNEPVLLTATGCDYGTVQWMYSGQTQWGNPVTVYGPGKYYARCFVTDHSTSPMISREIYPRTPGSIAIIPSQYTAFQGQMLTLTATGCNGGQVHWTYTQGGQTYNLTGRSVDVVGPNTYYAKCIVYGDTGPQSSITIPQASGLPKIITDKSRVRPNETFTFQVDFSNCPGYGWPGGSTLVTQEGVTTTMWGWDPITLTGPAVLEARCENAPWAKQTKEVFFAPGDNMRLVANKSKAKHNENVLLTTYGCDFGYVEWKIGTNNILGHPLDPKRQITQTGPGFYKARCKEDFMVNSDWVTVYVELDGSIVPVINGPNSLCPNTAATVTTAGCPSGYYNSWSTLEQGGFSYGGNSVTVYLPQTVKLRCIKNDNSWGSDEKPFTIASAIPDDIRATSNSPVVSGGTALLNATTITGATYQWTPPAGVTLPVTNTRMLQIPDITTAQAGEYKLRITSGGCVVDVSTRVDVDLCDNLYIKAFDPTSGDEKTRLNRKPGQLNLYDDLVLQVQTFEGDILKGVEYTWTLPNGVTANQNPEDKSKITINKIGNYKVNVTSTGGVSCPLEVDISALACATPAEFLACGSTSTITSTGTEKLKNLAVGDVFSTYDYVVSVTEVSGSEANGWTGRGVIDMSFLKLGPTALSVPLGVRFDNIHLNQCYQLLAGSKVATEFDETWSNVVDVQDLISPIDNTFKELLDFLKVYENTPENRAKLENYIVTFNDQKSQILNSSGLDLGFKQQLILEIDQTTSNLTCLASSSPGARTNSCSLNDVTEQVEESNAAIAPIVVWAIRSGGQCLLAAALDIATQYTLEGSLMWLDGEVNNLKEFNKIWPKVSYLQAGGTCLESLFGCTPCSASINGLTSIAQSLTSEYNKHGNDVEKYNWAGIGTSLFVDVAASYIGNVAGQELAEYFSRFNSRIAQQGYHQVRGSLRKFLPDNLADMLMHKASGLLSSAGKFADNVLEENYTKYIQRKQKQGGVAKDRLTWLEAVEYFQEKTNIPRGNAFNAKYKSIYPFNEVTLANGKRLDSYVPPMNGKDGEIISRKATDLIDIEMNTFKSYLSEIKVKYAPPQKINQTTASKPQNQGIGTHISGKMILEIPASNKLFSDISNYVNIAKSYGIEIRFSPE